MIFFFFLGGGKLFTKKVSHTSVLFSRAPKVPVLVEVTVRGLQAELIESLKTGSYGIRQSLYNNKTGFILMMQMNKLQKIFIIKLCGS